MIYLYLNEACIVGVVSKYLSDTFSVVKSVKHQEAS
jgi:hypothetical protein